MNKNAMLYCTLLHNVELKRFHSYTGEEEKNQQHTTHSFDVGSHHIAQRYYSYTRPILFTCLHFINTSNVPDERARTLYVCRHVQHSMCMPDMLSLSLLPSSTQSLNTIRMLQYKQTNTLACTTRSCGRAADSQLAQQRKFSRRFSIFQPRPLY